MYEAEPKQPQLDLHEEGPPAQRITLLHLHVHVHPSSSPPYSGSEYGQYAEPALVPKTPPLFVLFCLVSCSFFRSAPLRLFSLVDRPVSFPLVSLPFSPGPHEQQSQANT